MAPVPGTAAEGVGSLAVVEYVGFGALFVVWAIVMTASIGGMICAIAALVSISQMHADAFGPWWDNTKTTWMVGLAVSFLVPFGAVVVGVYWFWKGKEPLPTTGMVARPFWAGPPKPMPMYPPAGFPPPGGYGPPGAYGPAGGYPAPGGDAPGSGGDAPGSGPGGYPPADIYAPTGNAFLPPPPSGGVQPPAAPPGGPSAPPTDPEAPPTRPDPAS